MLKKRLIPVLLLQNGLLVRSENFRTHQIIGDPVHEVERFNEWAVDELIYLDISRSSDYSLRRSDKRVRHLDSPNAILEAISLSCFVPLTWGGQINSVDDMRQKLHSGADKIAINTAALRTPGLIDSGAHAFGSQAIVVSVDALERDNHQYEVVIDHGLEPTGRDLVEWVREAESRGAGEILLQSIDRDGSGKGYDTQLIALIADAVRIPVIACSGVGVFEHYAKGFEAGASAVAAANIWHFKEMADRAGKRALLRAGFDVRM